MKESLWEGGNLVTPKTLNDKIAHATLDACDEKQRGFKAAIEVYRSAFALWKYHQNSKVIEVFKAQVARIGELLEELDVRALPNVGAFQIGTKQYQQWKPRGMKGKWEQFMKDRTDVAIKTMDDFLKDYDTKFTQKKKDIQKQFDDLSEKKGNKRTSEDKKLMGVQQVMIKRIDAVHEAYLKKGTLTNWLK